MCVRIERFMDDKTTLRITMNINREHIYSLLHIPSSRLMHILLLLLLWCSLCSASEWYIPSNTTLVIQEHSPHIALTKDTRGHTKICIEGRYNQEICYNTQDLLVAIVEEYPNNQTQLTSFQFIEKIKRDVQRGTLYTIILIYACIAYGWTNLAAFMMVVEILGVVYNSIA